MIKLKLIVGGAKDTGKTSLIRRYISGTFHESTKSTIGVDFMTKSMELDGKKLNLSIWDFGGEKKFRSLFPAYLSGASGALLLYDITSRASFTDLTDWLKLIQSASGKVIKLLIGSKQDLEEFRQIQPEEVAQFCQQNHIELNMECSSKTGKNVDKIFTTITQEILRTNLKQCPLCGEMISKDLYFCSYCGGNLKQ